MTGHRPGISVGSTTRPATHATTSCEGHTTQWNPSQTGSCATRCCADTGCSRRAGPLLPSSAGSSSNELSRPAGFGARTITPAPRTRASTQFSTRCAWRCYGTSVIEPAERITTARLANRQPRQERLRPERRRCDLSDGRGLPSPGRVGACQLGGHWRIGVLPENSGSTKLEQAAPQVP